MQSLDTTALKEKPSSSSSFFLVVFPPTASSIRVLHVHFLPAAQTKPPMSWADALLGAPGLFFSPSSKGWSGLLSGWKMHLAPNYVFETFVCRIMSAYVKTSLSFRGVAWKYLSHFGTNLFHRILLELLSWHQKLVLDFCSDIRVFKLCSVWRRAW